MAHAEPHQHERGEDVGGDGEHAQTHGHAGPADRVEGLGGDPRGREGDEANGVAAQRLRGGERVGGGEAPALEEHARDGRAEHEEADRGREADVDREPQREVQRARQRARVARGRLPRHRGQRRRGQRDAEDAERELHHPVGVIEEGDRAGRQERGEQRVDEDHHLHRRQPEDGRRQQACHARERGVPRLPRRADQQPGARQVRDLHEQLAHPAHEHAERQRQDRRVDVTRQQQHTGDHADVRHGGPQRRGEEAVLGVQRAHRQRRQAHQHEVREHHPGELDRERLLRGIRREARGDRAEQPRRERDADERRHRQHDEGRAEGGPHEAPQLVARADGRVLGEHGDDGRRERALGQQPSQDVRDAVGDEERVGDGAGAEGEGDDRVAHEAEHAAREGGGADGAEGADDLPLDAGRLGHLVIPAELREDATRCPHGRRPLIRRASGAQCEPAAVRRPRRAVK